MKHHSPPINHRFSIAPMLDWTDRHARYFLRLISKHSILYTEMITTGALIHGDKQRFLSFNAEEHPVAIQLGGSNPKDLGICAQMAEDAGYDEINLNVGCPSDRVQNGSFGACLMAKPELVADCVAAMRNKTSLPVTVKHRIGIDDQDSYEFVHNFIATVKQAGCNTFIVHARKAILSGLSPKENREIPPLNYDCVYQLKRDFPDLNMVLNGGVKTIAASSEHLKHIDGVMMGREAYQNPYVLSSVDDLIYNKPSPTLSRIQVFELYLEYVARHLGKGITLNSMLRHSLGLFHGQPGGKKFRRHISENVHKNPDDLNVAKHALDIIKQANNVSPSPT